MASGQNYITPLQTPVVSAGAYSANDVVGGLLTFNVQGVCGSGLLQKIYLQDASNQKPAFEVWIFDAVPQTIADNGAFASAVTIATIKKRIGYETIATGDWTTTNSLAHIVKTPSQVIPFYTETGSIYIYLVCTGTPTLVAITDISIRLGMLMD